MRNVAGINCRENQNTHFMFTKFLPKTGKIRYSPQDTDDNIIRHMHFACWLTKATDTPSEYVIIIAFPRQKWLRELASILLLYENCLSFQYFSANPGGVCNQPALSI
jgi:hypothetical protein